MGGAVGYCPQEPQILSGSIADNIARFSDGYDFEAVVRAARLVGLHDRVEALPQAYGTLLGMGGFPLSAGLKQQVALARAFYGDPDLIVLDEPAVWVEQVAQTALLQSIDTARSRGAAVVLITHQPGLLRGADRIALVRAGSIEMLGPRAQVMERLGARAGTVADTETRREGSPKAAAGSASGALRHAQPVSGAVTLAATRSGRGQME